MLKNEQRRPSENRHYMRLQNIVILWKRTIRKTKIRILTTRNPSIEILVRLKWPRPPTLTAWILTMYQIDGVLTGMENLNHLLNLVRTQLAFVTSKERNYLHTQWSLEPTGMPSSVIRQNIRVRRTYHHWTPFSTMFTHKTRFKASSAFNKTIILIMKLRIR